MFITTQFTFQVHYIFTFISLKGFKRTDGWTWCFTYIDETIYSSLFVRTAGQTC